RPPHDRRSAHPSRAGAPALRVRTSRAGGQQALRDLRRPPRPCPGGQGHGSFVGLGQAGAARGRSVPPVGVNKRTRSSRPSTAPPEDYYAGTEGLSGDELKAKLHEIISEADVLSYSEVWDGLKATDEDPADPDNVILLYSGESRPKSANGGNQGDWNREHVWA